MTKRCPSTRTAEGEQTPSASSDGLQDLEQGREKRRAGSGRPSALVADGEHDSETDQAPQKCVAVLLEYAVMHLRSVAPAAMSVSLDSLLDEVTAVQELAAWEQPMTSVGLWSPEDLAGQATDTAMKEDLWQAVLPCVGVRLCFIETYNPTYYAYILTYNPK